jgi:hypothetical protein
VGVCRGPLRSCIHSLFSGALCYKDRQPLGRNCLSRRWREEGRVYRSTPGTAIIARTDNIECHKASQALCFERGCKVGKERKEDKELCADTKGAHIAHSIESRVSKHHAQYLEKYTVCCQSSYTICLPERRHISIPSHPHPIPPAPYPIRIPIPASSLRYTNQTPQPLTSHHIPTPAPAPPASAPSPPFHRLREIAFIRREKNVYTDSTRVLGTGWLD